MSKHLPRIFPRLQNTLRRNLYPSPPPRTSRCFTSSPRCLTDGVYSELTAMRTRTPFIEAFRKQQEQQDSPQASNPTEPAPQDLSPKTMADSYTKVILPLARDPWLLDAYINSTGNIRLGTLFMDLDALAGVVSYKHTGDSVMTVTAAVDRITLKRPLNEICDLELSGRVTFATGRSSMEVSLQVARAPAEGREVEEEDVLMTCAFTMVSLNPQTKRPTPVPTLTPLTPHEVSLFNDGQKASGLKKSASKLTLRSSPPNATESALMHTLWQRQLLYSSPTSPAKPPPHALYMSDTLIQSVQIMQPQYRNRHNFMIFGGFLLKTTFELAFTCVSASTHSRPTFIALDPSTFENPVEVGSVLYLSARIAWTDSDLDSKPSGAGSKTGPDDPGRTTRIQVRVDSQIRNIEHGVTKPTGTFNYTFEVRRDVCVIPRTYGEFMIFLDARRRGLRGSREEGKEEVEGVEKSQEQRI